MASPNQSFTFNAYQSNLAGPLTAGLTTVVVDLIPPGLGVPAYLVVDPDVPASREYIKVLAFTNNTIDNMERGLEGSAGDVDHLTGAVIRAVYTMQALDDTFLDIEANTTAQTAHINDVGDPHAAAGYQKVSEADVRYLRLDGVNQMAAALNMGTNLINNVVDPVGAQDAATKKYVDDADVLFLLLDGTRPMAAALDMANFNINQLATPILDDDASTKKYVDDEIATSGALFLPLTGGTVTGVLNVVNNINISTPTEPGTLDLRINRLADGVTSQTRLLLSTSSGFEGHSLYRNTRDGANTDVFVGDGQLKILGLSTAGRLVIERIGVAFQWRFAVSGSGQLLLQSSPDGSTWTTQETWVGT